MSEEQKTITVKITAPSLKPTKLTVTPPTVSTINLMFSLLPDYVFITNYDLISKSGSIFQDDYDIEKDLVDNELDLSVKILNYNEQTAVEQAQTFARINFSLSSHFQFTDCSQSVVGWISRQFQNNSPELNDLDGIFPEKYVKASLPRVLKHIDISKDPLSTFEQVKGYFLKLDVTTYEKQKFVVYCCEKGWVEKQKQQNVFPTLHLLMCNLSKSYNENFSLIAEKWCALRSAERQPFTVSNSSNTRLFAERKTDKKGNLTEHSKLQLFNYRADISSLSNSTLDDLIDNARAENQPEIVISQLEGQYANKAATAVSAIQKGSVAPFAGPHSYLYQDLFISDISAAAENNNDRGGIETANRTICNEIQAYSHLAGGNVRVVRPICIDFFTHRYVAQTVTPGLITQHSPVVYGYANGERNEFLMDATASETLKKEAERLNIAPSLVKGSKQPIYTAAESSGILSIDGHLYVSDIKRVTPRDANYPDPVRHHACIIRPEAISSYTNYVALEKHSEELAKLGGEKDFLYRANPARDPPLSNENLEKLEERRRKIIEEAEKPQFDINALTLESALNKVPQNISDIAKYLIEVLIPKFVSEYAEASSFILDGKTIVHEMHSRGINARYLGRVHELISSKKPLTTVNQYFMHSVESEIIARSLKTLLRNEQASINRLISSINSVVGLSGKDEQLFKSIIDISKQKFNFTPTLPTQASHKILIIRSVLSSFGVTLYSSKLEAPLSENDVAEIEPIVKFPYSRSAKFAAAVDLATSVFSEGNIDQALTLFQVALQLAEGSINPFDRGIATCYFYLSLIFDQKGDPESAFNAAMTSLIIQERYSDQLSPDIIIRYSLLARFSKLTQKNSLAFAFADRAASLARIIAPTHPWVSIEYSVAADLALQLSPELALSYAENKIGFCASTEEGKKVNALLHSTMSKAALQLQQFQKAADYANKAIELDPTNEEYKRARDLIKTATQK